MRGGGGILLSQAQGTAASRIACNPEDFLHLGTAEPDAAAAAGRHAGQEACRLKGAEGGGGDDLAILEAQFPAPEDIGKEVLLEKDVQGRGQLKIRIMAPGRSPDHLPLHVLAGALPGAGCS